MPRLYAAERVSDGTFTYLLTRMRENAESILFYGGQKQEVPTPRVSIFFGH